MSTRKIEVMIVSGALAALGFGCGGMEGVEGFEADQPVEVETAQQDSALFNSDACKNTNIYISNWVIKAGTARTIKVTKVKYYSASEGRWYTEGLTNETINYGWRRVWYDEDLQHAENDLITKWRVYYRYRETDGDWSDETSYLDDTPDDICRANDNYYMDAR